MPAVKWNVGVQIYSFVAVQLSLKNCVPLRAFASKVELEIVVVVQSPFSLNQQFGNAGVVIASKFSVHGRLEIGIHKVVNGIGFVHMLVSPIPQTALTLYVYEVDGVKLSKVSGL